VLQSGLSIKIKTLPAHFSFYSDKNVTFFFRNAKLTGKFNPNFNNNNIYLLQFGCHPVAVVILHVNKT